MRTKIGVLAAHLVESGWLAALIVVPIFFNVYTVRIFEEEKIPLFRSIALVVLFGLIVALLEGGAPRASLRALWRLPLVKPVLLLASVAIVSNCFSLRPEVSFWGGYVRSQGTYTLLCYLVIFFALVLVLRRREQVERLVTIVLLASLPPAIYAIAQRFDADPIGWMNADPQRSTSTAGNAIFVAAFMVMVAPVALARCLEHWARLGALQRGTAAYRSTAGRLVLYASLLAVQLATVAVTESRGPFVGLCAGMFVFALAQGIRKGWRWMSSVVVGVVAVGASFLFVLNLRHGPLAPLRDLPYIGRFGHLSNTRFSSVGVRFIVWQASADLLRSRPWRLLTGYGADTLYLAYRPFLSPELAHQQGGTVIADRAHNATYDALIASGVFGCAAEIAVVLIAILIALRALGLMAGGTARFALTVAVCAGAGALLPCLADGAVRLAGPGFALGIAVGLLVHLVAVGWSGDVATTACAQPLLLTGVLAAIVAHFVEIQVGIPVAATRLYFWTYAALVLGLAVPLVREVRDLAQPGASGEGLEAREGAAVGGGLPPPTRAAAEPWLAGDMVTVIPMVGLVLVVLCANFHQQALEIAKHAAALGPLFGGVWVAGAAFVALESGHERERLPRLATYAATTLGLCLLFLALYDRWTVPRGFVFTGALEQVVALAVQSSRRIDMIHGFVLLIVLLHAAIGFAREDVSGLPFARPPALRTIGYGVSLAAVALAVEWTNVAGSRADALSKVAFVHQRSGRRKWAAALQEEALRLRPWEDRYALELGSLWLEQAESNPAGSAEQAGDLERSRDAFERAEHLSPLDPDHYRNLAKLHRTWAKVVPDGPEREAHLRIADEDYRRVAALVPQNPQFRAEWATLFLENGDSSRALELLDQAALLDPRYTTTFWLRANTRVARGGLEEALADYDRALAVNPKMLPSLSGKAAVLARLDRLDEAIAVCKAALKVRRRDPVSWNNLVMLLRQKGDTAQALERAEAALKAVPAKYKPAFEELIAQLR